MPAIVILRLTILEAVRRRILAAALALGIVFLIVFGVGFHFISGELRFSGREVESIARGGFNAGLTLAGLYAVNFLAIAMGALLSADTLAGEISSGTVQSLVAKPIRRLDIVVGKWLGFALLLGLYTLMMAGGLVLFIYVDTGFAVPGLAPGLALIYLSALLVMTLTLALSSSLSTLATGGIVFGLYGLSFIGGWLEQFGAIIGNSTAVNIGIISSLVIPNDAIWRRAAFEMTPPITQSLGAALGGPFMAISVPSPAMVLYAAFYLAAALALAIRRFSTRDL